MNFIDRIILKFIIKTLHSRFSDGINKHVDGNNGKVYAKTWTWTTQLENELSLHIKGKNK